MTQPYKLLFVDEHKDRVNTVAEYLKGMNPRIVTSTAQSEEALLVSLRDFHPDAIIATRPYPFPAVDAYKLAAIGTAYPFVVVVDALDLTEMAAMCEAGVDDFFTQRDLPRLPYALAGLIEKYQLSKENNHLRDRLKQVSSDLAILSQNYESAREEEKLMISRELHDELGQVLAALKIDIALLQKEISALALNPATSQTLGDGFDTVFKMIDKSTRTVRKIASGLRPDILDKLGLLEALSWLAEETERRYKISCRVVLPDDIALEEQKHIHLFRIVQEALTNIVRHAEASEVMIRLVDVGQHLQLTISDDGKGISQMPAGKSDSLGLIGIRERVRLLKGTLDIIGKERKGTMLSITLPVNTDVKKEKA